MTTSSSLRRTRSFLLLNLHFQLAVMLLRARRDSQERRLPLSRSQWTSRRLKPSSVVYTLFFLVALKFVADQCTTQEARVSFSSAVPASHRVRRHNETRGYRSTPSNSAQDAQQQPVVLSLTTSDWAPAAPRDPSERFLSFLYVTIDFDLRRSRRKNSDRVITTLRPHSGLHNQRISFVNALVLSALLNRTLIVPPVRASLDERDVRDLVDIAFDSSELELASIGIPTLVCNTS